MSKIGSSSTLTRCKMSESGFGPFHFPQSLRLLGTRALIAATLFMGAINICQSAHAVVITNVPNGSFESPILTLDGDERNFNPAVDGWTINPMFSDPPIDSDEAVQIENPQLTRFMGASGSDQPNGGAGAQSASFLNNGYLRSTNPLLNMRFGVTYFLEVAIGDPNGVTTVGDEPGNLRFGFLSGTDEKDAGLFTPDFSFTEGQFSNRSFSYLATQADMDRELRIFLQQVGTGSPSLVNFDNIRLSDNSDQVVAAVPEPSTWAMMALGLGGVFMAKRRKRNLEA